MINTVFKGTCANQRSRLTHPREPVEGLDHEKLDEQRDGDGREVAPENGQG